METVRVILSKPHTHQGKLYSVGDEITVSPAEAVFLAGRGVAKKNQKEVVKLKSNKEEKANG